MAARTAPEGAPQPKLSMLGESAAGGCAGGLARGLVAPLDVLKIRFQLQRTVSAVAAGGAGVGGDAAAPPRPHYRGLLQATRRIVAEEGLLALWRGNGAAMLLWMGYMGVQFPVYKAAQNAATRWMGVHHVAGADEATGAAPSAGARFVVSLLAGGTAGGLATVATYQLDWARTRLASQGTQLRYRGIVDVLAEPLRPGGAGVRAWYQGLAPTLGQIIPAVALTFALYEGLGRAWDGWVAGLLRAQRDALAARRQQQQQQHLAGAALLDGGVGGGAQRRETAPPGGLADTVLSEAALAQARSLLCGALGGTLAKLAVYPLDTVKKRLQVAGMHRPPELGAPLPVYAGSLHALTTIAREEGILRGLYKGTAPSLLKAGVSAGLTFWIYEAAAALLRAGGWAWAVQGDREGPHGHGRTAALPRTRRAGSS